MEATESQNEQQNTHPAEDLRLPWRTVRDGEEFFVHDENERKAHAETFPDYATVCLAEKDPRIQKKVLDRLKVIREDFAELEGIEIRVRERLVHWPDDHAKVLTYEDRKRLEGIEGRKGADRKPASAGVLAVCERIRTLVPRVPPNPTDDDYKLSGALKQNSQVAGYIGASMIAAWTPEQKAIAWAWHKDPLTAPEPTWLELYDPAVLTVLTILNNARIFDDYPEGAGPTADEIRAWTPADRRLVESWGYAIQDARDEEPQPSPDELARRFPDPPPIAVWRARVSPAAVEPFPTDEIERATIALAAEQAVAREAFQTSAAQPESKSEPLPALLETLYQKALARDFIALDELMIAFKIACERWPHRFKAVPARGVVAQWSQRDRREAALFFVVLPLKTESIVPSVLRDTWRAMEDIARDPAFAPVVDDDCTRNGNGQGEHTPSCALADLEDGADDTDPDTDAGDVEEDGQAAPPATPAPAPEPVSVPLGEIARLYGALALATPGLPALDAVGWLVDERENAEKRAKGAEAAFKEARAALGDHNNPRASLAAGIVGLMEDYECAKGERADLERDLRNARVTIEQLEAAGREATWKRGDLERERDALQAEIAELKARLAAPAPDVARSVERIAVPPPARWIPDGHGGSRLVEWREVDIAAAHPVPNVGFEWDAGDTDDDGNALEHGCAPTLERAQRRAEQALADMKAGDAP